MTDIKTAETKRRVRILWFVGCASLALAALVLVTTGWTVYFNWADSRADIARAESNRVYLRTLNRYWNDMENAESCQRGFLLTGHDNYLAPYTQALASISDSLKTMDGVAAKRPDQRDTIARLHSLTSAKLDEMALTIKFERSGRHDAAVAEVMTDRGLVTMIQIRDLYKNAADPERSDVSRRSLDAQNHQIAAIEFAGGGGVLLLCLMGAGFYALTSGAAQQTLLAERLADSKEIFETTLTSIGDGVIATDIKARIEFINPEAAHLTGWSSEEAIGKDLDEVLNIVQETSRNKVESPFVQVMRTGSATAMANHTILIRRDGSEVAIDDSGAPIMNVYGDVRGVVLVFRGIEERRKAEAALQHSHSELLKANEELRQFSYAATHDLQEPLRTIVVFSQLLGRTYKSVLDERGHHLLETIEEAGHRMSSLINDLLAFTRVGGMDSAGARVSANVTEILKDALVQLNGSIEETKAKVTYSDLPAVWCEPPQLSQLFQNLISNAIKYRKPDVPPVIHISSELNSEQATFHVRDNGMGFRQEYAERIFLLFQRLHGRTIPGTGIGLALCRRIVERQGGRIWAESEENAGATFFFTLPIAQAEVAIPKQMLPQ